MRNGRNRREEGEKETVAVALVLCDRDRGSPGFRLRGASSSPNGLEVHDAAELG